MAETSERSAPRVSPRGRVVGLAALAVALLIAGAGLLSLWVDFNPPELQLLP
jgi:heme O synthase-like polyprenyltransferase